MWFGRDAASLVTFSNPSAFRMLLNTELSGFELSDSRCFLVRLCWSNEYTTILGLPTATEIAQASTTYVYFLTGGLETEAVFSSD